MLPKFVFIAYLNALPDSLLDNRCGQTLWQFSLSPSSELSFDAAFNVNLPQNTNYNISSQIPAQSQLPVPLPVRRRRNQVVDQRVRRTTQPTVPTDSPTLTVLHHWCFQSQLTLDPVFAAFECATLRTDCECQTSQVRNKRN